MVPADDPLGKTPFIKKMERSPRLVYEKLNQVIRNKKLEKALSDEKVLLNAKY